MKADLLYGQRKADLPYGQRKADLPYGQRHIAKKSAHKQPNHLFSQSFHQME